MWLGLSSQIFDPPLSLGFAVKSCLCPELQSMAPGSVGGMFVLSGLSVVPILPCRSSGGLGRFWQHARGSRRDAEGREQYRDQGLLCFLASFADSCTAGSFACEVGCACQLEVWTMNAFVCSSGSTEQMCTKGIASPSKCQEAAPLWTTMRQPRSCPTRWGWSRFLRGWRILA